MYANTSIPFAVIASSNYLISTANLEVDVSLGLLV